MAMKLSVSVFKVMLLLIVLSSQFVLSFTNITSGFRSNDLGVGPPHEHRSFEYQQDMSLNSSSRIQDDFPSESDSRTKSIGSFGIMISSNVSSLGSAFITYESRDKGFRIQYPEDWHVEDGNNEIFFIPRGGSAFLLITNYPSEGRKPVKSIDEILNGYRIDKFLTESQFHLMKDRFSNGDIELTDSESRSSNINGKNARIMANTFEITTSNNDPITAKMMNIVILDYSGVYFIFYTARTESDFDRYLPVVQNTINSIQIGVDNQHTNFTLPSTNLSKQTISDKSTEINLPNMDNWDDVIPPG